MSTSKKRPADNQSVGAVVCDGCGATLQAGRYLEAHEKTSKHINAVAARSVKLPRMKELVEDDKEINYSVLYKAGYSWRTLARMRDPVKRQLSCGGPEEFIEYWRNGTEKRDEELDRKEEELEMERNDPRRF
jgi:hypothetical protein